MKRLERIGRRERDLIEQRITTGYHAAELKRVDATLEPVLRTLLERLLPGIPANIDLVSFVDTHIGDAMGRGDRRAGLPPETDLFAAGLSALAEAGFVDRTEREQRALISRMRRGEADRELRIPAKDFVDRLLDKALAGYLAHPETWARIGFTGPAYPEGYAWIGPAEVQARHRHARGWQSL